MAGKVSISSRAPGARSSVGSLGRSTSAFHDRSTVMRPPRLRAMPSGTRDYAKQEQKLENPPTSGGSGFGSL